MGVLDFKVSSIRSPFFVISGQSDNGRLTLFFDIISDKCIIQTYFLEASQIRLRVISSSNNFNCEMLKAVH